MKFLKSDGSAPSGGGSIITETPLQSLVGIREGVAATSSQIEWGSTGGGGDVVCGATQTRFAMPFSMDVPAGFRCGVECTDADGVVAEAKTFHFRSASMGSVRVLEVHVVTKES